MPFFYDFLKKCKVKYQRLKYNLLKKRDDCVEVMFNKSFFDKNLKWNVPIAKKLVELIMRFFTPQSVVDVGCGNAEFLAEFKKENILIKGYEGSRHALENSLVDRKFIEQFDLRNKIISQRRYDLALCLEVAEHIDKKFSRILVDSLTVLADTIIFTAAPPGQGGHFHINEQPKEFWIEKFQAKGFTYEVQISQKIRDEARKNNILSWYSDNFMVFRKI